MCRFPTGPETVLADDPHRRVVRIGDTVRRPLEPWSDAVHALLDHLAAVGFTESPRFLGVDEQGREVLTAIDGDSGPAGWAPAADPEGLRAMARLLRRYHEAVAGFDPAAHTWAGQQAPAREGDVVCHGDFGPWNLVWRGTEPVGIIDFDYAWPQPARHDVCYALEYVAPFRDDAEAVRWLRHPGPPDRRARTAVFAEAYGLEGGTALVEELVTGVIAQQRLVADRTLRLAAAGHQPQRDWLAAGDLDRLADRIAWSEDFASTGSGGFR